MSNQLKIAAVKPFTRAPGVVAHYPCFQAVAEGAQLLDRSGAGNNAAFGAQLLASNAWAAAGRLTLADNTAGTQAGAPFISAAVLNLNLATESFIISGIYNSTSTASHPVFAFGEISGAGNAANGFIYRAEVTTGFARLGVCAGTAGTVDVGTASAVSVSGAAVGDKHVGMLYDGPARRLWLVVDGVLDATANSGTGRDVTSLVATMGAGKGGTALGNLVFGGAPRVNPLQQQVWGCTSYGWQVAKRTGNLPSNIADTCKRLARHPLQVLTATEWPA